MSIVFAVGDALEFDSQFRGFQACVSDWPGGISLGGSKWDHHKGGRDEWIRYWTARGRSARAATERGAYGLFWSYERTAHWTAFALDDAGWEICGIVTHHFAQGKQKSAGALKPATEYWWLVRNGGTEPLQIDTCRVDRGSLPTNIVITHAPGCTATKHLAACDCGESSTAPTAFGDPCACPSCGAARWWSCPAAELDRQSGERTSGLMRAGTVRANERAYRGYGAFGSNAVHADTYADSGGASRFFPQFYYAAKSPSRERHAGCHELFWEQDNDSMFGYRRVTRERYTTLPADRRVLGNAHPTPKGIGSKRHPLIARWLVRLITPPDGRVCDVTCGSGSIPIAAHLEGLDAVGMDICPEAITIAQHRAAYWEAEALSETRRNGSSK